MTKYRLSMTRQMAQGDQGGFRFINDPGEANTTSTFAGGEPASVPWGLIDLSVCSSVLLGQQVPQTAKYVLRGLTVGFRPTESGVNNESASSFSGVAQWYTDTPHGRKAIGLAREVEKAQEAEEIDGDSFFLSSERDYKAMRFGWDTLTPNGSNAQVHWPTVASIIAGGEWVLSEVASAYNDMTAPNETNALFNGRFPGVNSMAWVCEQTAGYTTAGQGSLYPGNYHDSVHENLYHSPLMGLLRVAITHSTMAGGEGTIQDDWEWWCSVDWEVVV